MAIHVKPILYELADLKMDTKFSTEKTKIASDIAYMENIVGSFDDLCKEQKDIKMKEYADALIKCMSIVCQNIILVSKFPGTNAVIARYYDLRNLLDKILKKFNRGLRIKYYLGAPLSLSDNLLYVTTFDFMTELQDRHEELQNRDNETQPDITDDMYEGIKRIQKVINKHKIQLDKDEDAYPKFSPTDKKLHDEDRVQITETQKVIDHIVEHFLGESNKTKYYNDFPKRTSPIIDQQLEPVAGGRFTRRIRKRRKNRNKSRR